MAVIQQYEDRTLAQGQINAQATPTDFGAGLGESIRQLGQTGLSLAEKMHENDVMDEVTRAHRLASQKHSEWEQQYVDRANAAKPGDRTFAPQMIEDINADMLQAGSQFKTRKAQNVFAELTGKLENSFGSRAIQTQSHLDGEAVKQDFTSTVDDESKLVNGNDANLKPAIGRITAMIDDPHSGYSRVPQTVRNELKARAVQVLAVSSVEGYFARDIYTAAKKLLPDQVTEAYSATMKPVADTVAAQATKAKATSSFDSVVKFILSKEGGYKATDGNSGNPVNFGINQKANPDIDVKNLTKEGAVKLYRERYWDAIGADNLPPALAVVAMNAAVNQGVSQAKQMLTQANGDPAAFTELVKQRYQSIVTSNPAQGKYLKGWLNRADSALTEATTALPTGSTGEVPALPTPPTDAQGLPLPQLKIPRDVTLMPPQGVDIPGWNELKLDTQQKFMGVLVRDFNSRVTVDRATIADDRKNMIANLLAGNKFDGQAALQARYSQAYGPEMAARMIKEDDVTRELGQFTNGLRGRSMEEISAALGPPPKDNATAGEYDAYKHKLDAVKADRAEFQKSPVDYVAKYSPAVQRATQAAAMAAMAADKQPSPPNIDAAAVATQNMITASMAEQRRLGAANPTVLSETAEKQLAQRLEAVVGSGRDVAQGIDNIYKSYGSYAQDVAAQMSKKNGGLMNVLGSGIDQSSATLLVEASRNQDAYKKTLSPDNLKDLEIAVQTTMAPYADSLRGTPNGTTVQANYQEQISHLAMARMSKFGESQTEAVQKAYKALVTDMYNFQDGYRVPKALDAKAVQRQANITINNLQPSDIGLLPGAMGNAEDRIQSQLASLRAYGKWVTASIDGPDGRKQEGLMLMYATGGGYDPVVSPSGERVFRSFGQLLTEYEAGGVQTSQDALQRGDIATYNKLRSQERAETRRAEDQRMVDMVRAFRNNK